MTDHQATGRDEVEVAHEALIRHWPRLRAWLDEDRSSLLLRESVREAAQEWERGGWEESYLAHRGRRLDEATALQGHPRLELNALERAYLDANVALRERELSRAARVRKAIVAASLAVALVAAVLAGWALVERSRAEEQRGTAVAEASAAEAEREKADRQANLATVRSLTLRSQQLPGDDDELRSLLARQAYLFDQAGEGTEQESIDEALRSALGSVPLTSVLSGSVMPMPDVVAENAAEVSSVTFNSNGDNLFALGNDGSVRRWDLGQPGAPAVLTPVGLKGSITAVALDRNGQLLAVAHEGGSVQTWNLERPNDDPTMVESAGPDVYSLAFSPNSRILAGGGAAAGTISVWDLDQSGNSPITLFPEVEVTSDSDIGVSALAFSPNGEILAGGRRDGAVALWTVNDPPREPVVLSRHESGMNAFVYSMAFSPNGRMLAAGRWDTLAVWDLDQPTIAPVIPQGFGGARTVTFSPDGRTLAGGASDTLAVWDVVRLEDGPAYPTARGSIAAIAFSPDGHSMASGSEFGTVILYDYTPPGCPTMVSDIDITPLTALALSPNHRAVAAGAEDGTVRLWNLSTPETAPVVLSLPRDPVPTRTTPDYATPPPATLATGAVVCDQSGFESPWSIALGHNRRINALAFSASGEFVVAARGTDLIRWKLSNAEQPDTATTDSVLPLPFSPEAFHLNAEGRPVVAIGRDSNGVLLVISRRQAALMDPTPLLGLEESLTAVSLSRDGRLVVGAGNEGSVAIWNLDHPGTTPRILPGSGSSTVALALSDDRQKLAVAKADGSVTIWDPIDQDHEPVRLRGSSTRIITLAMSPDGKSLAAAREGGTVAIWDLNAADPGLPTIVAPRTDAEGRHDIRSMVLSADGSMVASTGGDSDGTVSVWLTTKALANAVCEHTWRNLEPNEWRTFVGELSYEQTCPNLPPSEDHPDGAGTPSAMPEIGATSDLLPLFGRFSPPLLPLLIAAR